MSDFQIYQITNYRPSLQPTDLFEGQTSVGGTGSSFKSTLGDIERLVHEGKGWTMHHDAEFTSVSPKVITSGSREKLTLDDIGVLHNTSQSPIGVDSFYNITSQLIEPISIGDMLHYRITVTVKPSNSNVVGSLELQIEDSTPIVLGSSLITFPDSGEYTFTLTTSSFVIQNYIDNGAAVYLSASGGSLSIHDFKILIERTFVGR